MKVQIRHPSCTEDLEAQPLGPTRARLKEFSTLLAMGPGDIVKINGEGQVTGMVRSNAFFLVEAHLTLGIDQSRIDEKVHAWRRATDAQQTTGATIRVQTSSVQWLEEVVRGDPDVEELIPLRMPRGTDAS